MVTAIAEQNLTDEVENVIDGKQAFMNLMSRVFEGIQAKKLYPDEVAEVCQRAGITSLPVLANCFGLIPQVAMDIEAIIISR